MTYSTPVFPVVEERESDTAATEREEANENIMKVWNGKKKSK